MRVLVALACVVVGAAQAPPEKVQVELGQGVVEAARQQAGQDRYYYSFWSIPFAKPPVGPLRFKDPEPAEAWEGVRNGPRWTPACTQFDVSVFQNRTLGTIGEENCLYLNVHTPKTNGANLPVLVWIPMGGFAGGSSAMYMPMPLLTKDLVLVTIQFRLNVLGFLSTGDSSLPGNLGLKDQVMALRWVQDNIIKFGGDPNRVTLGGDDTGGASVHYHILSPMSQGLFQRAIIHSGSALAGLTYREDHRCKALKLAKLMNCTEEGTTSEDWDTSTFVDCLSKIPASDLVLAQWKLGAFDAYPFMMVPGIDGEFLPDHPARLLRDGRYSKVDIMIGVVRDQGAATTRGSFLPSWSKNKSFVVDGSFAEGMGFYPWDDNPEYLLQRCLYNYFEGPIEFNEKHADTLEKVFGDSLYKHTFYDALEVHGRDALFGKKTFAFELQHKGENSYFNEIYGPAPDFAKNWIIQDDDMQYLFDYWLTSKPMTNPEDLFIRRLMLDMWTNFVIYGHPTPDLELGFKWEEASSQNSNYLSITLSPTMKPIDTKVHEFWKNLPTKMNKLLYPERF